MPRLIRWRPTVNPDKWIQAFNSILSIDVKTIILGHGLVCDKTEVRKVGRYLSFFRVMWGGMKKLIRRSSRASHRPLDNIE